MDTSISLKVKRNRSRRVVELVSKEKIRALWRENAALWLRAETAEEFENKEGFRPLGAPTWRLPNTYWMLVLM